LGDKKVHTQRNSVCARLPVHLKPEFLLGSAYLIAEFLSKLYLCNGLLKRNSDVYLVVSANVVEFLSWCCPLHSQVL
ncbi:MAG: hypothetical protein KA318_07575, partial [Nitrosomonas sp.]|nr:hypothetical protein [Nitrosomonas sp.]